ncbi:efflux RND transporter periplasmic adaptor subunit [Sodalis sp. dw_96]|uniref:efflux RND transporter periplasmic adaptor subunit n=1 Tax=Sodalis sp. dw_96 TaxID=2719794 RepID=UPI001BD6CC74|nr:efflux RND transporter periplasmic adaptor subunit [Sodalis sp. dw_96]
MAKKNHSSLMLSQSGSDGEEHLPTRGKEWRHAKFTVAALLIMLALGAAGTVLANLSADRSIKKTTRENAVDYVEVVTPKQSAGNGNTLLPGTLRGYVESPIYARATGYLLHWYDDIGTHVKQGQLLAELDTPEIDQELLQAVAQRGQISSSLALAKSSYDRWSALRKRDAVSQQELDERKSTYLQDVSNLAAADANVKRLRQLESFKRIVAPFDGVITQRNVDVGSLIDAGSASGAALFSLTQTDPLRVYVQLPQAYSQNVKVGQQVDVTLAELAGKTFQGTITHISGAIDVPTRSLQVEVNLSNHDNLLRPGAYVQVSVPAIAHAAMLVPENTLIFRSQGPQLATVDNRGIVHLRTIRIAQDLGQTLALESGIDAHDRVIINPSDSVADGDRVQIAQPAPGKKEAK